MSPEAASLFVLPRGYGPQAWWWDRWLDLVRDAGPSAVPDVSKEWPHRDESDPRWSEPRGFSFIEDENGMLAEPFYRSQLREGLWFDDLYAIARAPWNAEQAGVEIALFNAQGESLFVWSPAHPELRPGDLAIPDLAPHDGFDPQRLDLEWWRAEVRRFAGAMLPEIPLRQVAHPALRPGLPTPDLRGVFRVRTEPWAGPDGTLMVYADRFLPFRRGLAWEELTAILSSVGNDASELARGAVVACGDALEPLAELVRRPWLWGDPHAVRDEEDIHNLLQSAGVRDRQRFEEGIGKLFSGEPVERPRGLGRRLVGDVPEVVRRPKDFGPEALGALVFRYVGGSRTNGGDPALPPGWSAPTPVSRDDLVDALEPQEAGAGVRVTVVCDHE